MSICKLSVGNFRGLKEDQEIELRPITLFIGPNSSGKSSCIHALASLAQTLKLPNNTRPITLDDEFAYVHLGRFIEVIHSKSYSDQISLGLDISERRFRVFDGPKTTPQIQVGRVCARYGFKCLKRTQDTVLDHADVAIGDYEYKIRRTKAGFDLTANKSTRKILTKLKTGFLFDDTNRIVVSSKGQLENVYEFLPLGTAQTAIQEELRRTLYLGPFRQSPLRRYPTRGSNPTEVGAQGEATITLLANESIQSRTRPHLRQIAGWLAKLGLAKALDVTRVGSSDLFDVSLTLADEHRFPIADLGYGLSQVLPVLTQCSFAPKGATLLFEQPELHLHSLAARPLAKVFIETAQTKNVNILAETHSPELFGQFVRELRDKALKMDEFIAYRVSREDGRSVVKAIEIEPDTFDVYERWEQGLSVD
jgi:AAA domain, putative AbiEii toxin, Type IV TA system